MDISANASLRPALLGADTEAAPSALAHDGTAKFRLWWIPQVPMEAFRFEVPDYRTGKLMEEAFGLYDLFQLENNIKPDFCNVGGVEWNHETLTEGEWHSLDDDEAEELGLAGAPA